MPRSDIRTDYTSPNHSSRNGAPVSLLVLHYTGMPSMEEARARLCSEEAQVSAHYLVGEDGKLWQLVAEGHCAWHAGVSAWKGFRNVNPISIGVEIVNPGHEWGYRVFPEPQMQALAELGRSIIARHGIKHNNIVGHSDVAPQRKEDPGELFDWKWLSMQGVGIWPAPKEMAEDREKPLCVVGDKSEKVMQLQQRLAAYGYDVPQTGHFDACLQKVVIAFQRHFRARDIRGIWDAECEALLDTLLLIR